MRIGVLLAVSNGPPALNSWSSLFKTLSKNAGTFSPFTFETEVIDGVCVSILDGVNYWSYYLVGLFLDSSAPYKDMFDQCKCVWNLKGKLQVQYFNAMFYFEFANKVVKLRALKTNPLIILGKPFIVSPWSFGVDNAREKVLSVSVWTTFTHISSALQPLIGSNWLVSLIGDRKCFDTSTEARKNLLYARALIEIIPTKPLPSKLCRQS